MKEKKYKKKKKSVLWAYLQKRLNFAFYLSSKVIILLNLLYYTLKTQENVTNS